MANKLYNIFDILTLLKKNDIFTQIQNSISFWSDSFYELLKDVEDIFIDLTLHHEGIRTQQIIAIVRTYHCLIVNVCFELALSLWICDCSLIYWAVTFDDIVFISYIWQMTWDLSNEGESLTIVHVWSSSIEWCIYMSCKAHSHLTERVRVFIFEHSSLDLIWFRIGTVSCNMDKY
jgi:hypothetical protein